MSEDLRRVWIRNNMGVPFNYNGQIVEVTGSLLVFEDELKELSQHTRKGTIEIIGIEGLSYVENKIKGGK